MLANKLPKMGALLCLLARHARALVLVQGARALSAPASARPNLSGSRNPNRASHDAFLRERDWEAVRRYYRALNAGRAPSPDALAAGGDDDDAWARRWVDERVAPGGRVGLAGPAPRAPRAPRERATFCVTLGYDGSAFVGWQRQGPDDDGASRAGGGKGSVAGVVRAALAGALGAPPSQISSAGRTDAGVSAFAQVCSFYTWEPERLGAGADGDALAAALRARVAAQGGAGAAVTIHRVQRVPRAFHPAFSASWRRYAYLLPLRRWRWWPRVR